MSSRVAVDRAAHFAWSRRWATARLLHCNEKTVRRLTPLAVDMLSEILIDVGLLEGWTQFRKILSRG